MKKTKIIVPAMALLALGTAASVTGTVAWFSVNNQVSVNGMQVKTKVQSNMLIAADTIGSTGKLGDENFSGAPLNQVVKGILEPVSTLNAIDFFYTTNAKADGSNKVADTFTAYSAGLGDASNTEAYLNKFSEDYGLNKTDAGTLLDGQTGAVGYVEYVYQLKVVNTSGSASNINLTELTLTYTAASTEEDAQHAFRVAIFCQNADATIPALSAGDKKGTWKPTTGADFENKVASATNATSANSYVSAATPIASVPAGSTHYYKVVTRLWIEGQDNSCNNDTFAALTGSWALTMQLELGTGTPVTALALA